MSRKLGLACGGAVLCYISCMRLQKGGYNKEPAACSGWYAGSCLTFIFSLDIPNPSSHRTCMSGLAFSIRYLSGARSALLLWTTGARAKYQRCVAVGTDGGTHSSGCLHTEANVCHQHPLYHSIVCPSRASIYCAPLHQYFPARSHSSPILSY